jgi:hypothetical protein
MSKWKLVDKDGKTVEIGQTISFRDGDTTRYEGIERGLDYNGTGKITVSWECGCDPDDCDFWHRNGRIVSSYYHTVFRDYRIVEDTPDIKVKEDDPIKVSYTVTFTDRPCAVVYSEEIAQSLINEGRVSHIKRNVQVWYGSWERGDRAYTITESTDWYEAR